MVMAEEQRPIAATIQLRRGTDIAHKDKPVLQPGEVFLELDRHTFKVGEKGADGKPVAWADLPDWGGACETHELEITIDGGRLE